MTKVESITKFQSQSESESYSVILTEVKSNKINLIKWIRTEIGLSLSKANEKLKNLPWTVDRNRTQQQAINLQKTLHDLGAIVYFGKTLRELNIDPTGAVTIFLDSLPDKTLRDLIDGIKLQENKLNPADAAHITVDNKRVLIILETETSRRYLVEEFSS